MIYYVLEENNISWRNQLVWAEPKEDMAPSLQFHRQWYEGVSLNHIPQFGYFVNKKAPKPDNLITGDGLSLYSKKLIDCLANSKVNFETFEVTLYDKKTKEELSHHYRLFHLLETHAVIDSVRSTFDGFSLRKMVLNNTVVSQGIPMIRDVERPGLVFITKALKLELERQAITGFAYALPENYR